MKSIGTSLAIKNNQSQLENYVGSFQVLDITFTFGWFIDKQWVIQLFSTADGHAFIISAICSSDVWRASHSEFNLADAWSAKLWGISTSALRGLRSWQEGEIQNRSGVMLFDQYRSSICKILLYIIYCKCRAHTILIDINYIILWYSLVHHIPMYYKEKEREREREKKKRARTTPFSINQSPPWKLLLWLSFLAFHLRLQNQLCPQPHSPELRGTSPQAPGS